MIRNATNQLSIRPKMSAKVRIFAIAAAVISTLAALYLAHVLGVRSGHLQYDADRLLISQLDKTIVDLREELVGAEALMINAQRQKQIQEEAYNQISSAYSSSEQKNSYLGSRLDFYRSIISPEDGQTGPAIQSAITSWGDGELNFDITLVQAIKHKHQVQGSLQITLFDGDAEVGKWPMSNRRSVNFQYFQQVSGLIAADNSLKNARIKVELSVQDGGVLERWFDVLPQTTEPVLE